MSLPSRLSGGIAAFAASMLLCGATASAQMQSAPTPTPQAMPEGSQQTQPGMAPVDPNANPTKGQTAPQDRVFVEDALKGGMAEVKLGQLALQKSNNADVKQFAQKMVDDHTKMGDRMKTIAEQIGVKVPDNPSKKDQETISKLGALNGDAFDKAYMKDMVKDHKNDLNDFKSEAQNGSNPVIMNAASQGVQIISQHLQMAEQINGKTNSMASNGTM